MSNNIVTLLQSQSIPVEEEKRSLEHEILRAVVEGDDFVLTADAQRAVVKLRELCRRLGTGMRSIEEGQSKEGQSKADPILIAFATTVITAAVAAIVKGIEELLKPPVGFATVYNPGPPVKVWTYDETDGVRWIAFKEYSIGTNEAVPLTARGNNAIQVVVIGKPSVHTLAKGQSYAYDGNVMQPRTA